VRQKPCQPGLPVLLQLCLFGGQFRLSLNYADG
jgi:hypothetical protein